MSSDPLNLRGVVLGSRDYKDRDRIISFLSSTNGVIDICIKGSSKLGSKFAAITIPFVVADIVVSLSGSFYYIKDYSIVCSNSGIMNSLEAMTVASHCCDLLCNSFVDSSLSYDLYELATYTFFYLSEHAGDYRVAYSAFNWKYLKINGIVKKYDMICSSCAKGIPGEIYYDYLSNKTICSECHVRMSTGYSSNTRERLSDNWVLIGKHVPVILNYFYSSSNSKLFSINIDEYVQEELVEFTTRYLSIHLEKEFNLLSSLRRNLGS